MLRFAQHDTSPANRHPALACRWIARETSRVGLCRATCGPPPRRLRLTVRQLHREQKLRARNSSSSPNHPSKNPVLCSIAREQSAVQTVRPALSRTKPPRGSRTVISHRPALHIHDKPAEFQLELAGYLRMPAY